MLILIGLVLIAEGLWTGVSVLSRVSTPWAAGDWIGLGLIAIRAAVGLAQFTAGWLLFQRRTPGRSVARWAIVASAAFFVLEIGAGLAPGNTFPTGRWWIVFAYGLYAAAAIAVVSRRSRD